MTPEDAAEQLRGEPVVPIARSSLDAIKDLCARCIAAEIPAVMRRPPEPGG